MSKTGFIYKNRRSALRRIVHPLLGALRRSKIIRSLAQSGEYSRLRGVFIRNGRRSKVNESSRTQIVDRFETIDQNLPIATTPVEGLVLAEIALSVACEGALVECGCYAGGSTAKLSVLAHEMSRSLYVFDSFEGLPEVDCENRQDFHTRHEREWVADWSKGRYACGLDDVQTHVQDYGEVSACTFVKGWFTETLVGERLPKDVAMAFVDVDIPSSAEQCLVGIWPRLSAQGVFVSHDVAFIKVMQTMLDPDLWATQLKCPPPIFFGAGFGMGDLAPHMGFAVKDDGGSAAYVKELTLEK